MGLIYSIIYIKIKRDSNYNQIAELQTKRNDSKIKKFEHAQEAVKFSFIFCSLLAREDCFVTNDTSQQITILYSSLPSYISRECLILSIILTKRFLLVKKLEYGYENHLATITLIIAYKTLEDDCIDLSFWAKLSGIPLYILQYIELQFLTDINWDVHVKFDEYNKAFDINFNICFDINFDTDLDFDNRKVKLL